ncbi:MAG: acyl carrier protein [Pseudomonadota bacterium]
MQKEDVINHILTFLQETPTVKSEPAADSPLVGSDAILDSSGVLELLLDLEELAEDKLDTMFDWATDSAFSETRSVFRTPNTLADFFLQQISI